MKILAIETSCDETAASVVENGIKILSNVVATSADLMAIYGGVVPEIAARSHIESILPVIEQAVKPIGWDNIDAIAVTNTPGLLGSLLIGTLTARTLAIAHNLPLYPVHHIKSHIYANWLESDKIPSFPALALVVSGGHTQLIYLKSHIDFEIIGTTRDDAVGEAFDKVAKILGLPYPGGPNISKSALNSPLDSNPKLVRTDPDYQIYQLPIPKIPDYDFSFSGLKTAVLRAVQKAVEKPIDFPSNELKNLLTDEQKQNFAASFQNTAVEILVEKLSRAVENFPTSSILLGGGVSANVKLREKIQDISIKHPEITIFTPKLEFTGDNAAMVGSAAYFEIKNGKKPVSPFELEVSPTSFIS